MFDGLGLNLLFTWGPEECTTHSKSGRVSCRSGDRTLQGRFKPLKRKVGRLSFAITFKKLNLMAPFGGTGNDRDHRQSPDSGDRLSTV